MPHNIRINHLDKIVNNFKIQSSCSSLPFVENNLIDAPLNLPKPVKYLMLREWQAFQYISEKLFVFIALYDTKKISLVKLYIHFPIENKTYSYLKKIPSTKISVSNTIAGGTSIYKEGESYCQAYINYFQNKLKIDFNLKADDRFSGTLKADFNLKQFEPSVVVMPLSKNRWIYSTKTLTPAKLILHINKQSILTEGHLFTDDHKGFYPYITKYDWLTAASTQKDKIWGINLTDNQVQDQDSYNENALWLDGQKHYLPPVKFHRPEGVEGVWIIKDKKDRIRLSFHPQKRNSIHENYILAASKYEGPPGIVSGTVRLEGGDTVELDKWQGMGEQFYLRA